MQNGEGGGDWWVLRDERQAIRRGPGDTGAADQPISRSVVSRSMVATIGRKRQESTGSENPLITRFRLLSPDRAGRSHMARLARLGERLESAESRQRNFGIRQLLLAHDRNPKMPNAIALPWRGRGTRIVKRNISCIALRLRAGRGLAVTSAA